MKITREKQKQIIDYKLSNPFNPATACIRDLGLEDQISNYAVLRTWKKYIGQDYIKQLQQGRA